MVETLSQNEIEALLSALSPVSAKDGGASGNKTSSQSSGNFGPGQSGQMGLGSTNDGFGQSEIKSKGHGKELKVERSYDFRRQTKFSKEQLNTLHLIHESFVRLLGTDLSGRLRAYAQATLISVEQRTFEEFVGSIYNPTFITVFRSDTLEGKFLIDMNLKIVFSFLDRLLGGSGVPLNVLRQLTEVEKQIMQRIMIGIIDKLRESWQNIVDLAPVIELIESNPQFAQIASPTSVVIAVAVELKVHDITGMLHICIPYNTVQSITHKFRAASWFTSERNEPPQTQVEVITEQVRAVHLPVVAELGSAKVTLEDVVGLQPGDLIITDQRIKDDLKIKVGNLIKFKARPGILGKKMAVSITEVIDPNEDIKEILP